MKGEMKMSWKIQIYLGAFLLVFGLVALLSSVLDVDFFAICFPVGLILLGVFLVVRPSWGFIGPNAKLLLIGDYHRRDEWLVETQEVWSFIGNIRLDLTKAVVPTGESTIRVIGFINDTRLILPENVAISMGSTAFIGTTRFFGNKRDHFFSTIMNESPGYQEAEKKVRLEVLSFISEIRAGPA
jgi:hypothetical protein